MKYRFLPAIAAAAAVAIPASGATAQSAWDILNAVARAQAYQDYRYRFVSERQAVRIAQRQGVRVERVNRAGPTYHIRGRDRFGARIDMRIDVRTGQIVRFDRRDDRRRWDRDRWDDDRWERRDRDRWDDDDDDDDD